MKGIEACCSECVCMYASYVFVCIQLCVYIYNICMFIRFSSHCTSNRAGSKRGLLIESKKILFFTNH